MFETPPVTLCFLADVLRWSTALKTEVTTEVRSFIFKQCKYFDYLLGVQQSIIIITTINILTVLSLFFFHFEYISRICSIHIWPVLHFHWRIFAGLSVRELNLRLSSAIISEGRLARWLGRREGEKEKKKVVGVGWAGADWLLRRSYWEQLARHPGGAQGRGWGGGGETPIIHWRWSHVHLRDEQSQLWHWGWREAQQAELYQRTAVGEGIPEPLERIGQSDGVRGFQVGGANKHWK